MGIALAASIGATMGLIALLAWIIGRGRPKAFDGQSGTISPERISALFTVVCGMGFAVGAAVLAWNDFQSGVITYPHLALALGAMLGGLAIGGFMSPSLTNLHNVSWTPSGVNGPSNLFGPTLGLKRETLRWEELAKADKTATGYWYVQSRDGRRVYWSYLYKGWPRLAEALRNHCPELALPPDMG